MKRHLFVICLLMAFAISINAQNLVEVRGVETKPHSEYIKKTTRYDDDYNYHYNQGFVFTNQNSYPVSIEATYYEDGVEKDSKSFELDSKESYFWKVFLDYVFYDRSNKPDDSKTLPSGYVKYKAFKTTAEITE